MVPSLQGHVIWVTTDLALRTVTRVIVITNHYMPKGDCLRSGKIICAHITEVRTWLGGE
jgi:hypothetical protein